MPIQETRQTKFHPTARNQIVAAADVKIRQVQLIDKKGQIRSVVVWQCGSDMFYANNMDGMFDVAQRRNAPDWLKTALLNLPADKQFSYDGSPKGESNVSGHIPTDDSDAPDFVQG